MLKRWLRNIVSRRNRERGQSTVEFVVVIPFLFLIFFLIVDFGWLFKNWIVVTNAARETSRCASVDRCLIDGELVTPELFARQQIINGLGSNVLDSTQVTVRYVDDNDRPGIQRGDSVLVCINADNEFISPVIPFLSLVAGSSAISDSIGLKARNEMRLEQTPLSDPDPENESCNFDDGP